MSILDKRKKHERAWLVKNKEEAVGNKDWAASVLNKETLLNDWGFFSPRKPGEVRPSTAEKMAEDRKGWGNPALKKRKKYNPEILKKRGLEIWENIQEEELRIQTLKKAMENEFPGFVSSFPHLDFKESKNKYRTVICHILNFSREEWDAVVRADRGKRIKKGQSKPESVKKLINALKKSKKQRGYVSRAHKALFYMIKSVDSKAKIEFQIPYKDTWRSFDVFSPKNNTLIEMHGRSWHDPHKAPENLKDIAQKNMKNDEVKKELAETKGYKFCVFWDDETDKWETAIEVMYGKKPKSFSDAYAKALSEKRNS